MSLSDVVLQRGPVGPAHGLRRAAAGAAAFLLPWLLISLILFPTAVVAIDDDLFSDVLVDTVSEVEDHPSLGLWDDDWERDDGWSPDDDDGTGLEPFTDVPEDHPAYEAVRRLIAEGFMEGHDDDTFRGRRVITRYDFAMILGKMLARMEKVQQEREAPPSPEELLLLDLTREFRRELSLLGIRVDGVERRIRRVDRQTRELDRRKSNVRMEGFYRVEQTYAVRPLDYTDYPFEQRLNRFRHIDEPGLGPLNQELYLRFVGTPWIDEELYRGVEVFCELRATLSGIAGRTLRHQFAEPPVIGDEINSIATHITDDRRVDLNRAHMVMRAKRANLRLFANEAITDLTDPFMLLSGLDYQPFMGAEGAGSYKKLSYFGSILRRIEENYSLGYDGENVWELFRPDPNDLTDNYAFRFTYEPYLGSERWRDTSLRLGLTFNETVWSYDQLHDYNRVMAVDAQYDRRIGGRSTLESELSILQSSGRGDVDDWGVLLDLAYRSPSFLGTVKAYGFGPHFQAAVGRSPYIDTDVNFNYRRTPLFTEGPDTTGERLVRLQGKYDVPRHLLQNFNNVTLSLMYQTKFWKSDPAIDRPSDRDRATRFYVQALADITDRTHFEFLSEIQKDLPLETAEGGPPGKEKGMTRNEFRFDYRIRNNLALLTELSFIDDMDSYDPLGRHFSMKRHSIELNSQVRPWLFLKGNTEMVNNSDIQPQIYSDEYRLGVPRHLINGRNVRRYAGEAVLTSRNNLSLRTNLLYERIRNEFWPWEDQNRQVIVGELGMNLTRALKARWVHAVDRRDMLRADEYEHVNDRTWMNSFVSVLYRPTETTEFELTYGDEYDDPRDRYDTGTFNFFNTARILQLKAQTAF